MDTDPLPLPPRHPAFRPGLIFERLLDPAQAGQVNHYALKHLTGKAASRGEKRLYTPAEVRLLRQHVGPPDPGAPRVLALRSLRRRSGRTTLAANLGAALAFMGYRVLCIDADPQGDLGACCGVLAADQVPPCDLGAVLVDFLQYRTVAALESALVPVFADGMLDLLAGGCMLATLDAMLGTHTNAGELMERLLAVRTDFFARYDVVLIDCAPGSGRLQALFSSIAQLVVMPVRPDPASLAASAQLVGTMARVERLPRSGTGLVALANCVSPDDGGVFRQAASIAAHTSPWPVERLAVPLALELDWQAAVVRGRVLRLAAEAAPFAENAGLFYALGRALLARISLTGTG